MDADFSAEGDKKLTFEAPWDFDSGLGNKMRCKDGTGFYAANIVPDVDNNVYETINPWLAVLMNAEWYQEIIREKWTAAYDSGVLTQAVQHVTDDKTAYADAFKRDNKRWGSSVLDESVAMELSAKARKCVTQGMAADYLADWLQSRVDFMNEQWHK